MMNMKDNRSLNQAKEGFFSDLYQNIRLIIRLMGDSRVNIFLKALPVGALIYLVVPYDLCRSIPWTMPWCSGQAWRCFWSCAPRMW